MFVHPDLHLNKLSEVRIPSGKQLFERYGFSQPTGHPDNTNPRHFSEPSNKPINALQKLQSVVSRVEYNIGLEARETARLAAEAKAAEEAAASEAVTKKDDKRSAEDA